MANGSVTLAALEAAHGQLPRTAEVATGGGGKHLFLRDPHGLRSGPIGPGLDLKAEGGYVVAPPSGHLSGTHYRWTRTLPDTVEELPEIPTWLVAKVRTSPSGVDGERLRELAQPIDGASYPRWLPARVAVGTRHNTVTRFAGWLRGCGYGEDAIVAELRVVVASRVEQPAEDAIDDAELVTLARTMSQKPITRFRLVDRYAPLARRWPGRRGRTDRKVLFEAVLPRFARCLKLGERVVPMAARTVAMMARIGVKTAALALKRLVRERGILQGARRRADVEQAICYRLVPPPRSQKETQRGSYLSSLREDTVSRRDRDAFRHGALGWIAGDIYRAIGRHGEHPIKDLVALGIGSRAAVYRAVGKMAAHKVLVKGARGWQRGPADLAEVAEHHGVLGKVDRERERYARERARYHSEQGKRQRERDRQRRSELQNEVSEAAHFRGWPSWGAIDAGERPWKRFIRSASRQRLIHALTALRQRRRPSRRLGTRKRRGTARVRTGDA